MVHTVHECYTYRTAPSILAVQSNGENSVNARVMQMIDGIDQDLCAIGKSDYLG